MQWFIVVVIIVALAGAAIAASGRFGEMSEDPVRDTYQQDLPSERWLSPTEVDNLRFGVAVRGYVMGQVDEVLDRLTAEIRDRDALIAELRLKQRSEDG